MNSTQHHTIYFIIVSEFNQISFELMYYPSPSLLFPFPHKLRLYIILL